MHIRLIAVGDRQAEWVDTAVRSYVERLPADWRFRVDQLPTARRVKRDGSARAVEAEGKAILGRVAGDEQLILLDERGDALTSKRLAKRLEAWQADGRDIAFVIGGPDGVSKACRERAQFVWSLSSLTLPHGLARVLCVEQLYRGWSISRGHPYHRE